MVSWSIAVDLEFHLAVPAEIRLIVQRLDLVILSVYSKSVYVIELTVPLDKNIDCAHQRKLEKYDLQRAMYKKKPAGLPLHFPSMSDTKNLLSI